MYNSTVSLSFFSSTSKEWMLTASLPDPKGPLSEHLPTALVAEANIEVLKAVAEAKEPQKKGYTRQKLPSLP